MHTSLIINILSDNIHIRITWIPIGIAIVLRSPYPNQVMYAFRLEILIRIFPELFIHFGTFSPPPEPCGIAFRLTIYEIPFRIGITGSLMIRTEKERDILLLQEKQVGCHYGQVFIGNSLFPRTFFHYVRGLKRGAGGAITRGTGITFCIGDICFGSGHIPMPRCSQEAIAVPPCFQNRNIRIVYHPTIKRTMRCLRKHVDIIHGSHSGIFACSSIYEIRF